jgi:hypothetical protein
MKRLRTRVASCTLAAGALLCLAGCGESRGDIEGKVIYNGQPLPGGIVTVYPSASTNPDDGPQPKQCTIQADGYYFIGDLPLGPTEICVQTHGPFKFGINQNDPPREVFGKFVAIPKHFNVRGKSGLSIDVKKGKQDHNIELSGQAEEGAGK